MFTWTFRLAPVLLLSGCVGLGAGLSGGEDRVALTDDGVVVVGPRGYCVEPGETRDSSVSGFAVFGNCANITGSRLARQPAAQAILTAAVSAPSEDGGIAASLPTLPDFFRSPDGARVLSRTNDPETVEVLQSFVAGDVFFLRASDVSPGAVPGTEDVYWRAYFDNGARIVTLSVLALEGSATGEAAELSLLESFVTQTRSANPDGAVAAEAAPTPASAASETPSDTGLFNSGFFRRIVGSGQR